MSSRCDSTLHIASCFLSAPRRQVLTYYYLHCLLNNGFRSGNLASWTAWKLLIRVACCSVPPAVWLWPTLATMWFARHRTWEPGSIVLGPVQHDDRFFFWWLTRRQICPHNYLFIYQDTYLYLCSCTRDLTGILTYANPPGNMHAHTLCNS